MISLDDIEDMSALTMSQHLYLGLRAEGFDVVCMEARQVNAALSATVCGQMAPSSVRTKWEAQHDLNVEHLT